MAVDNTSKQAHRNPESLDEFKAELQSEIEALTKTVKQLAQHVKASSQEQGCEMMDKAVCSAKENPLRTAGIACGIGVLIGMILKR